MTFHVLIGVAAAFWLVGMGACGFAFRWSWLSVPRRFWAAVILSVTALVLGCLGLTRFHVVASKTVNGQIQWRFDSRWFFIATVLFATLTLAYTLWKQRRSPHAA
ncbi:MAG: hypothetical protein ACO1TE_19590 [Prosthecobacter sp.]